MLVVPVEAVRVVVKAKRVPVVVEVKWVVVGVTAICGLVWSVQVRMRVQRTTVNEEKKIKTYLQGDGGGGACRPADGWAAWCVHGGRACR